MEESVQRVFEIIGVVMRLEQAVTLAYFFIWAAGFYILYQLYHLKFLKLLIWGEVGYIIYWFWRNQAYFIGNALFDLSDDSQKMSVIFGILELIIRLTPFALSTVGAGMGLIYLQKIWKKKSEQAPALYRSHTRSE